MRHHCNGGHDVIHSGQLNDDNVMKSYNDKKKFKRYFPMDFYGDGEGWRFAVRAESPMQVLAAKIWVSCLCVRRREFRIVDLAIESFHYMDGNDNQISLIDVDLGTRARIRRQGQVVTVDALNQRYGAPMAKRQPSVSAECIEPASKIALS
ncbi:hypothetical protein [Salinivibrio sp. ES.052]|uniref:hypothetical protein n=1 Tax=Salinivibrio sp. ES.052 TaxID=1882823 RepID=UPI0009276892|nr:hypothetical protein [Salinivibrio sp. ES.052]SIO34349.1 hypothetical protein SAMN05444724_2838 [Salinivibrio sp. ES.052]